MINVRLPESGFIQEDMFRTIIYRDQKLQVSGEVEKIIFALEGKMKRSEIQNILQLKHDDYFRVHYILPALELRVIEMTIPDKPKSKNQKYRLTKKGLALKSKI